MHTGCGQYLGKVWPSYRAACAMSLTKLCVQCFDQSVTDCRNNAPSYSVRQGPLSGLPQHNHPMAVHTLVPICTCCHISLDYYLPSMTRCPCMVVRVVYPPFVSCVQFTLTCEIDTLADSVCPFGKGVDET